MSDYLTRDELADLTGKRNRPGQVEWLRARRWKWVPDADGRPRVLRAYRDKRLLDESVEVVESFEPDFTAG